MKGFIKKEKISKELIEGNEKGVSNMDTRNNGKLNEEVRRKGVSSSPVVQQDINNIFAINAGITNYMTANNAFYEYVHTHYADKSSAKLPYLADTKVLHADAKYLKCIADGHIKISPYGFYESAASAMLDIYKSTMQQLSNKISERVKEGVKSARERGRFGGRPATPQKTIDKALQMYDRHNLTVSEICRACGISRPTLYKAIRTRSEKQELELLNKE